MHSLDDAFRPIGAAPTLPNVGWSGHRGPAAGSLGIDLEYRIGGQLPEYLRGEHVPADVGESCSYAPAYRPPYDPDPGEPDSVGSAYLPYVAGLPEPLRQPPPVPAPATSAEPMQQQAQYDDLLMSDQWLEFFMLRLSSPIHEPVAPSGLGPPDGPADLPF